MTIADFVADLRAPTPSAAAEVVSRNQQELLRQVQSTRQRLEMAMDYYLANRTKFALRKFITDYSNSIRSSGWHASKPCLNACKNG